MPRPYPTRKFSLFHAMKRFWLSTFVIFSFAVYAIHERFGLSASDTQASVKSRRLSNAAPAAQPNQAVVAAQPTLIPFYAPTPAQLPPQAPAQPLVSIAPTAIPQVQGAYKDGNYTGQITDAFYGPVQVKVTIQGGRIADVQFVDYPHDRRLSQMINSQAMPWLTQEAIQVQNANVDIISGATLTSEAFAESLQTALDQARS